MTAEMNWFTDIKIEPALEFLNSEGAMLITKIAIKSPAEILGLQVGDMLISVNGESALTVNLDKLIIENDVVIYHFFQENLQQFQTVKTQALHLGMRTEPQSSDIILQYQHKSLEESESLMILWERSDYAYIRKAIATKGNERGGAAKTVRLIKKIMRAVCDIETGKPDKGYASLDGLSQSDKDYCMTDMSALLCYYHGKRYEKNSDDHRLFQELHYMVEVNSDSERMMAFAHKHEPDLKPRDGRRLGGNLQFIRRYARLDGGEEEVSLREVLLSLTEHQVLPVCLMHSYRANWPYNEKMAVYTGIYPHIKDRVGPMFVITTVGDTSDCEPRFLESEMNALSNKIPIIIAHDPTALFADGLNLMMAPEFVGIDRSGNIIFDESLNDGYAYWKMLADNDAARSKKRVGEK